MATPTASGKSSPAASPRKVSIASAAPSFHSTSGFIVPEVFVSSATPTGSELSFEPAPSNTSKWEMKPYRFNCPALPRDETKEHSEQASVKLPEYHLLVDHALGVTWKCCSNGRRDVRELLPDQVLWAQKLTEAHSHGQRNKYSEYLGEVCVSLCAGGMGLATPTTPENVLPKTDELTESSFILTNMRSADDSRIVPIAYSTPLQTYSLSPPSSPDRQVSPRTSPPRTSPHTSTGDPKLDMLLKLEELHAMLVKWKENRLKVLEGEMGHLEVMEKMLHSLVITDRQQSS